MQLALKALPTFEETDINKLASETTRLQLAGIPSFDSKQSPQCMSVNESGLVDSIFDKVIHKIGELSTGGLATIGNAETQQACANFDRNGFINRRGSRRGNLGSARTEKMPVFRIRTNHKGNVDRVKALTI